MNRSGCRQLHPSAFCSKSEEKMHLKALPESLESTAITVPASTVHDCNLLRKALFQLGPLELEAGCQQIIVRGESLREQVELLDDLKTFHASAAAFLLKSNLHSLLHSRIATELLHTQPKQSALTVSATHESPDRSYWGNVEHTENSPTMPSCPARATSDFSSGTTTATKNACSESPTEFLHC